MELVKQIENHFKSISVLKENYAAPIYITENSHNNSIRYLVVDSNSFNNATAISTYKGFAQLAAFLTEIFYHYKQMLNEQNKLYLLLIGYLPDIPDLLGIAISNNEEIQYVYEITYVDVATISPFTSFQTYKQLISIGARVASIESSKIKYKNNRYCR